MRSAVEIADTYLAGREGLLDAAIQLQAHVDPRSALWLALKGSGGPHEAIDVADRLGFLVGKEVQWEREAFKSRQTQLAEAEIRLAPAFRVACQAIVEYAKNSN